MLRLKIKTVIEYEKGIEVLRAIKHSDEIYINYKFFDEVREWRIGMCEWDTFCKEHDIKDWKLIVNNRLAFSKEDFEERYMPWENIELTQITTAFYVALHEYEKSTFIYQAKQFATKLTTFPLLVRMF